MRHRASVEYLPHLAVWVAWCQVCGQISLGLPEPKAWEAADQHNKERHA